MKNSLSQVPASNTLLKKLDYADVLEVVYESGSPSLDQDYPLKKNSNRYFKRAVDFLLSSVLILLVLSWLLPLMAILIKSNSKGPVLFLQKRNKKNGNFFTCIKFRTMVVNQEADTLPAIHNDGRITAIGHFLRRHHLDELPQLLNVWWGDMSLIGPRPHMVSDNIKYEELLSSYSERHYVKPGITGLAQVSGFVGAVESLVDMKCRLEEDIYYINNWSPVMDAKIIYRTIFRMTGIRR
jgi:lipopolysaccharide/colanic/teichoic acid biosynthesis glycosyltransferase